ncbi:transposase [Martelella soudanensis]|uniref:transposase n=1 Tax=Martelella sp. NC20 TaxID=2740298 RepID=UPI00211319F5|nr:MULTISPECIES: transposase [unclassified Martelella]
MFAPWYYNAQAVVDADGTQLIVATNVATTPSDQPTFVETMALIDAELGTPKRVLGDAGYASGEAVTALKARGIEPLVAISSTQPQRPYDFRPPPDKDKPPRAIKDPWRIEMKEALETKEGRAMHKLRKQTVEPVFGILKSALGFRNSRLRGLEKVKSEWSLVALACNVKRMAKLRAETA